MRFPLGGVAMRTILAVLMTMVSGCVNESGPDLSTRSGFAAALGREQCEAIARCCGTTVSETTCMFSVRFYEELVNDPSVVYLPDQADYFLLRAQEGYADCEHTIAPLPLRGTIRVGGACGATLTSLVWGCEPGLGCIDGTCQVPSPPDPTDPLPTPEPITCS